MKSFDVVIVGGGIIGSAIAYFLAANDDFKGSILVIEKDSTYSKSSTTLSVGGIRQQFSTPENIEISKFAEIFIKSIKEFLSVDGEIPEISFKEAGYLFLATNSGIEILRKNFNLHRKHHVNAALLSADEIKDRFPWINVSGIAGGSLGLSGEGWIDPYSLLMAFIKKAKSLDVSYLEDELASIELRENKSFKLKLFKNGEICCGFFVNAAGTAAAQVAEMAGIKNFPVSSRKRFVYSFKCQKKIKDCPLVIDPSGAYFRPEGGKFLCGVSPPENKDPDCSDLKMDYSLFDEVIWPVLAERVKYFNTIKRDFAWAGFYAYNYIDQNAILGFHPEAENFIFANGFSGHGLQQAPAVGRAISELIAYGSYKSLDLSKFSYERFTSGDLIKESEIV